MVNNFEMAHLIHQRYPDIRIMDINKIISEEQAVIERELKKGNSVKVGKLYKLYSVVRDEQIHYDGLHKKKVKIPQKRIVKEKQLSKIKKLFD